MGVCDLSDSPSLSIQRSFIGPRETMKPVGVHHPSTEDLLPMVRRDRPRSKQPRAGL